MTLNLKNESTTIYFDGSTTTYGYTINKQKYTHKHTKPMTTLQSEATALKHALQTAKQQNHKNIQIKGDSQVIIQTILGASKPHKSIKSLMVEIHELLLHFDVFTVSWVSRVDNIADSCSR